MLADRTAFQRDILYVLAGLEAPAGIDIKHTLSDYYVHGPEESRLYQNLNKLVDAGFVEKGKKDDRTNEYRLTAYGRDALEDHTSWQNDHLRQSERVEMHIVSHGVVADES